MMRRRQLFLDNALSARHAKDQCLMQVLTSQNLEDGRSPSHNFRKMKAKRMMGGRCRRMSKSYPRLQKKMDGKDPNRLLSTTQKMKGLIWEPSSTRREEVKSSLTNLTAIRESTVATKILKMIMAISMGVNFLIIRGSLMRGLRSKDLKIINLKKRDIIATIPVMYRWSARSRVASQSPLQKTMSSSSQNQSQRTWLTSPRALQLTMTTTWVTILAPSLPNLHQTFVLMTLMTVRRSNPSWGSPNLAPKSARMNQFLLSTSARSLERSPISQSSFLKRKITDSNTMVFITSLRRKPLQRRRKSGRLNRRRLFSEKLQEKNTLMMRASNL